MNEADRKSRYPSLQQVRELPLALEHVIPPEWEDRNGHVNVQFYLTLFEFGWSNVLEQIGVDDDWFERNAFSIFDLEHHLNYLAEIGIGDRVTTYNRIVGTSEKRFHGLYFVVNETRESLACVLEYISAGIDMKARRTAAFPGELSRGLDDLYREHRGLSWKPPLCGIMAV